MGWGGRDGGGRGETGVRRRVEVECSVLRMSLHSSVW